MLPMECTYYVFRSPSRIQCNSLCNDILVKKSIFIMPIHIIRIILPNLSAVSRVKAINTMISTFLFKKQQFSTFTPMKIISVGRIVKLLAPSILKKPL